MCKKVAKHIQWGIFDLMNFMGKNCASELVVGYKPVVSELLGCYWCAGVSQGDHCGIFRLSYNCLVRKDNCLGNPPQYSCLGNPMGRGAWQATVHRVAKSWIQLRTHTHTHTRTHTHTHTHTVQMEFAPNLESPLWNEKDDWNLK